MQRAGYVFHAFTLAHPICAVAVTDEDYPSSAAHRIVRKVYDEFSSKYPRSAYDGFTDQTPKLSYPELSDYVQKYRDPETVDATIKIQRELDETKVVLHKTIESVLERGVKLDDLVQKSEGLSAQSKMFYTQVGLSQNSKIMAATTDNKTRPRSKTRAAPLCEDSLSLFAFLSYSALLPGSHSRDKSFYIPFTRQDVKHPFFTAITLCQRVMFHGLISSTNK
jgi:hypothetical protein